MPSAEGAACTRVSSISFEPRVGVEGGGCEGLQGFACDHTDLSEWERTIGGVPAAAAAAAAAAGAEAGAKSPREEGEAVLGRAEQVSPSPPLSLFLCVCVCVTCLSPDAGLDADRSRL